MIISGYQGIGKSSLSQRNQKYIDLESSCFWVKGKRQDDWYEIYCNIAEHLSKQGYVVFVSPHEVVRNRLKKSHEYIAVCIPSLGLKDKWIEKLKFRWVNSPREEKEKNYKAYMNAVDKYEDVIKEIMNAGFPTIVLDRIDYDLQSEIERGKQW